MHRVIVVGRLSETKIFKDSVASFGIASDEIGKTTMWFNAKIFKAGMGEKSWEFITRLKKGDSVFADGNLKEEEYEDKNGEKKKKMSYIVTSISYAGGGKKPETGDAPAGAAPSGAAPSGAAPKSEAPKGKGEEDDGSNIPF